MKSQNTERTTLGWLLDSIDSRVDPVISNATGR